MANTLKYLLASMLVCFTALLAWQSMGAIKTGYCDFNLGSARAQLRKANANQAKPMPLAQWQATEKKLKAMQQTCGNSAQIPADLANLYLLRAQHAGAVPEVKSFFENIALGYLQQSLRLRPAMAQNWANVALIKASLGEFDSTYQQALRNARQLAPNDAAVLRTATLATLISPAKNDREQIAELQAATNKLPVNHQRSIRALVKEFGYKDW